MEGEAFYPRLLAHDDAAVRNLAQRFVDEFGGIYDAFGQYTKHWSDAASIERDPVSFARETRGVMKLLAHRMTRESNELYPLADALG